LKDNPADCDSGSFLKNSFAGASLGYAEQKLSLTPKERRAREQAIELID
jgi:hypothetical protein